MRTERSSPDRLFLLIAGGALAFLFVWFQWRLLLLAFAGMLVSILLHTVAEWVGRHTRVKPVLAYLITLVGLAAVIAGTALLLAPRVITQLSQAAATVPHSVEQAKHYFRRSPWGSAVLELLHRAMQGRGFQVTAIAKAIVTGAVDLVVVAVIGFFGALNPRGYREGLLSLVPAQRRRRARELSGEIYATLRSWLFGQMVPMVVLGLCSMIGLWALGVPLAFTLGLITGLMIFMPYVGSVSSGIFAILMALQRSTHTALYVLLLYCVIHLLEGYLLTPFVQKKAVRLPPILTILSQFCLWTFGGILGVAVAAPMAATGLVIVKSVYLKPNRAASRSVASEVESNKSTDANPAGEA